MSLRGRVGRHTKTGGRHCQNWPEDQQTVMRLLNSIPVSEGGAGGSLGGPIVSGVSSDALYRAISRFEDKQFPGQRSGFVDPGGAMLKRMEEFLARTATPKPSSPSPKPLPAPPPLKGVFDAIFYWSGSGTATGMGVLTLQSAFAGESNGKGTWYPSGTWTWRAQFDVTNRVAGLPGLVARVPPDWYEDRRGLWSWHQDRDLVLKHPLYMVEVARMKEVSKDDLFKYLNQERPNISRSEYLKLLRTRPDIADDLLRGFEARGVGQFPDWPVQFVHFFWRFQGFELISKSAGTP